MDLRRFNNLVKGDLLRHASGGTLFDIGVGRGGDLHKWIQHGVRRVRGVDIDHAALEEARKRTREREASLMRQLDYKYYLCGPRDLDNSVPSELFDVVSCQFAIHYFFRSWDSVDALLACVMRRLRPGGLFLVTALDAFRVGPLPYESATLRVYPTAETNGIRVVMPDTPYFGPSGEAGRPEYKVYPDTLIGACEEVGLELVSETPFSKYGMKFGAHDPACDMYTAFVFKKK